MNYFEKNMQAIAQGFPELFERLNAIDVDEVLEKDNISIIEGENTPSGEISLYVQLKNQKVIRLNSSYSPKYEASRWIKNVDGLQAENILLFGLGSGEFAKEVVNNKGPKSKILIFEPSLKSFLFAISNKDMTDFFGKDGLRLIIENVNEDLFLGIMEEMVNFENVNDYSFIFHPKYLDIFPASKEKLLNLYARDGMGWIKTRKNIEKARLFISPRNQIHNLKYLKNNTSIPNLSKVIPKDVPILMLGAGPSLKENIDIIKKYRDKFYLFAADSALNFLAKNEIIPDAFGLVEASKPKSFFEDDIMMDVPMFTKVDSPYYVLDEHRAKKIFGYEEGFPYKVYEKYNIEKASYRNGANVLTFLFAAADEMKIENVIFVGQDMCFGEEKVTHVDGRNEGFLENEHFLVENNEGNMVQSRLDWLGFINWYENAIFESNIKNVINTSIKGAKIRGTRVMSLEEAIKTYGKDHPDFGEVLNKSKEIYYKKEVDLDDLYENCLKELEVIKKITNMNPRDPKRKEYLVYELLKKYEISDEKDDFTLSQMEGIEKLEEIFRDELKRL